MDIIAGASLALRTVNPALSVVKIRLRLRRRRTRYAANETPASSYRWDWGLVDGNEKRAARVSAYIRWPCLMQRSSTRGSISLSMDANHVAAKP